MKICPLMKTKCIGEECLAYEIKDSTWLGNKIPKYSMCRCLNVVLKSPCEEDNLNETEG